MDVCHYGFNTNHPHELNISIIQPSPQDAKQPPKKMKHLSFTKQTNNTVSWKKVDAISEYEETDLLISHIRSYATNIPHERSSQKIRQSTHA